MTSTCDKQPSMVMLHEEENKSLLKLAQFKKLLEKKSVDKKEVELIIQGIDLNHKFPSTPFLEEYEHEVIGNTLLHLAYDKNKADIFDTLIDKGADFNAKDFTGRTVLHKSFQDAIEHSSSSELNNQKHVRNSVLSAHVKYRNIVNSSDPDGLTHLHIACAENSIEAVELFLSEGVPVNQTANSKLFAGYTLLHFAVHYACLDVVKILLKYGANVSLTNAKGQTPLQVCVERNIVHIAEGSLEFVEQLEEIMMLLLDHSDGTEFSHLYVVCSMQNSVQAVSLLRQQIDVNQCISMNSPNWPGYTALHFAAQTNVDTVKLLAKHGANMDAKDATGRTPMAICIDKYRAEDIFDIICSIPDWKNIVLSDGKTKLIDLIFALKDLDGISSFLQESDNNVKLFVPFDSPLFPGFTVLHLSETLSERVHCKSDYKGNGGDQIFAPDLAIITECLKQGADVTVKNRYNCTPIHVAFRSGKVKVLNLLLQYHHTMVNPVDEVNLSHLHIACAMQNRDLVERFLWNKIDVNIAYTGNSLVSSVLPGWTPLHVAVDKRSCEIVKLLLKFGADRYATDYRGYAAVHQLTDDDDRSRELSKVLFSSFNFADCVVRNAGLSYLQIACCTKNVDAVKKLLDLGVSVNRAFVRKEMENPNNSTQIAGLVFNDGNTPLHITLMHSSLSESEEEIEIAKLLIERGADMLTKNSFNFSPLHLMLISPCKSLREIVMSSLTNDHSLRRRVEFEIGLTMLHLACHKLDFDLMKELLDGGANVNAQIHKDSSLWSGFTPLHVLLQRLKHSAGEDENIKFVKLLLSRRADVTLSDDKRRTPLHIAHCKFNKHPEFRSIVTLLLKAQENFEINPANIDGISHFHVACNMLDVDAVEEFLEHEVDVNSTIDFFHDDDKFAACTPLLLVIRKMSLQPTESIAQLKIVDMLIKHGAEVNVADALSNTPAHYAASADSSCTRDNLLQRLANSGADMNARNLRGAAPLELLIKTGELTHQDLRHFIACGCIFNTVNLITEVGYIADAFDVLTEGDMQFLLSGAFVNFPNTVKKDDLNRTPIHNIVSSRNTEAQTYEFADCFDALKTFGCDIEDPDILGRTPLHWAAIFRSLSGVEALLLTGADINMVDESGKTPFAHIFEPCCPRRCNLGRDPFKHEFVIGLFVDHVKKLQLFNLDVSPSNEDLATRAIEKIEDIVSDQSSFLSQAEELMKLKIEPYSLTVADFLSDTGAVVDYPTMSRDKRKAVNEFFQANESHVRTEFEGVAGLFQLQYRKALKRYKMIDRSLEALIVLANFEFPHICSHIILRFLKNLDLENLIAAAFNDKEMRMEVDLS